TAQAAPAHDSCGPVCDACAETCTDTVKYLHGKGNRHATHERLALLKKCITYCKKNHKDAAATKACADACSKCAASCEASGDEKLKACAETCKKCAEVCNKG